eukprot:gnl/TRDRNA2_/TRDRNA2_101445_c0_seq4.p1 gnl/TRDRNA2_/TRDRNA2_101445_c0~~gnl/TRDRNA2_/TRDRNA2_101445_c0_seq4.p1  ORF type:complete len:222 (-),score=38.14 gnl/TRDRNA2_/TRDRNA2_101445_c0_seq4:91-756(-)
MFRRDVIAEVMLLTKEEKMVRNKDVALLTIISGPLRLELQNELYEPYLTVHPLFNRLKHRSQHALATLTTLSTKKVETARGDLLFNPGEEATAMYFLIRGALLYSMGSDTKHEVKPVQWFCESVLWAPWVHHGRMRSKTESELLVIDGVKFREVMKSFPAQIAFLRQYACAFIESMQDDEGSSDDADDVKARFKDIHSHLVHHKSVQNVLQMQNFGSTGVH